ncbi:hypothetical protein NQ314_016500 [Rhamnusium bicolor]|uniref:HTH CENPB-type domain-containing protein n=1 Tax=Rhamnusium bicolor TaxID=1586634 RepID=A0AAV8WW24_9CUCU|nr:hypothetical protein NQ314_016500 [Rhamnusium bicolor]
MGRDKQKYTRFKYSEENLALALAAVKSGSMKLSDAAKRFDVPKSTIHNKIKEKVPNIRKMGPAPVLSTAEEDRLQNWILSKAKLGFPMHPNEVKDAVQKILKTIGRINPFVDDRPGNKWLHLFLKRNPNISKRNTEIISKSRASVTESAIREWFSELRTFLENDNILDMMNDGSRIFNADETGVRTCTKSGLVLAPKNYKNLYEIASGPEKESITVLCNYSASGIAAPPMVVFPYKRVPKELALTVPEGWAIGRSDSGWMTAATFFEYVANVFYPWLVSTNVMFPVILFIDGHKSHYNLELYEFCVEKRIILYCLYPNATHILQPCDVSIFRPLKVNWREVCRIYRQKTNTSITRHNFCPLFKEAFEKTNRPDTIINGFKACGLYPLNANAVDYSKCISTRRGELFPKDTTEENNITIDDYTSALNVMKHFLGDATINSFNELLNNNNISNDDKDMYSFWKFCKLNTNQENLYPENEILPADANMPLALTESFLDNLPLKIDEILYEPPVENNVLQEIQVQDVILQLEGGNFLEHGRNEYMRSPNPNSELGQDNDTRLINVDNGDMGSDDAQVENGNAETEKECTEILHTILEAVFTIAEDKENKFYPPAGGVAEEQTQNGERSCKIKILSDIRVKIVKKADQIDESVWKEHMHWPKQGVESKKRTKRESMPFAKHPASGLNFNRNRKGKKQTRRKI